MHILVTGGLGFIGSNFVRHVLKTNKADEITSLDVMSYGSNPSNVADLVSNKCYRFVKGDISDESILEPLVAEADIVVNFAAETHVDRSLSSSVPFIRSNVLGVHRILESLRSVNGRTRFIQIGTDEEYGEISKGSFIETDTLTPSSPYAATKASASMLVMAYARTYGLHAMITRCTNNFGPYQFPEKLIPKTIIRAHLGLAVPVYGDGLNSRDWIHVEDHCEAVDLVLRKGKSGSIYNIAGGNELTNLELVRMILKEMNKPESMIEFVEDRPGHDRRYSIDDGKIRRELGWRPKHDFEPGLKETIQWYLNNEAWWRPIANEKTLSPAPWKLEW